MKKPKSSSPVISAAKQIDGFINKFDPKLASQIRACRALVRKRLPTAFELVYDNYNFFVLGYSSTERTSDTILSLAANAKGIGLSFYWGATLPDPHKLLQGSGNQNRFIRLPAPKALADTKVVALINDAIAQAKTPLSATTRGVSIVKSVSAKQRPRR
jgi:hypothetical protein